ncbi:discoidin domain-containing protein [Paenibacillus polymyxa]|uniref:discoidin domain-containing protein n=1 Tax=Paenibacillus polymyxa TaxID=1406 RepID=UPI002AB5976B|nr:discoidin domain-containing protein [Paenibacillus polymyxa]MDY8022461.1 discoidin domain-containing protein [Paenibacillus polymyxa]
MKIIRNILIIIFLIVLVACNAFAKDPTAFSSKTVDVASEVVKSSDKTELAKENRKKEWALTIEEGKEDPAAFLVQLEGAKVERFLNAEKLISLLQSKEDKEKYRDSYISVGRITDDGNQIAFVLDLFKEARLIIQIYDLDSGNKANEFELPYNHPVISSDLTKYLYEKKDKAYIYDTLTDQSTAIRLDGSSIDVDDINQGRFSPDSTQFCFTDTQQNIVIFDVSKYRIIKKIHIDSGMAIVNQWVQKDKIIYSLDSMSVTKTYLLNVSNGEERLLGKGMERPLMSRDGSKLWFEKLDSPSNYKLNINTGFESKAAPITTIDGSMATPVQWFYTANDFSKYESEIKVYQIKASSTLSSEGSQSYDAKNLVDGNKATAWCEGVKGNGEGETIVLDLGSLHKVNGIQIINGYAKSEKSYRENNRVQKLKLQFSDGSSLVLNEFNARKNFKKPIYTSFIKLTILSVERGTKYQDTCISDLRLF